ncbi:hypothetical protein CYY_006325 [Polysphondylium violaceum]|uniref:Transmembrane protein n=1 Tax=Polysphondylium violaceum TaxID=133409 RepID=A0A8J4PQM3_9MYCE|nr:hypothetical protein CYY_006325 [Polysphondylium violaceum]
MFRDIINNDRAYTEHTDDNPSTIESFRLKLGQVIGARFIASFIGIFISTIFLNLRLANFIDWGYYFIFLPVAVIFIPCFFTPLIQFFTKKVMEIKRNQDPPTTKSKRFFYYFLIWAPFIWFSIFVAAIILRLEMGKRFQSFHIFVPIILISLALSVICYIDRIRIRASKLIYIVCCFLLILFTTFVWIRFDKRTPSFNWVYIFVPLYVGEVLLLIDSGIQAANSSGCIFKRAFNHFFGKVLVLVPLTIFFIFLSIYLEYQSIPITMVFIPLYVAEVFVFFLFVYMAIIFLVDSVK